MAPSSYSAWEKAADLVADARRWVLAGGLVGGLAGLLVGLAAASPYEASATVLLRGTDAFVAFTTDGLGQWTAVYGRRPEYGTEESVLASRDVLAAAVDSLGGKRPTETWNEAAERLGRSIRVDRLQGRVARVTATAGDPDRAADRANAVVDAYLGQHWSEQWHVVGREVAGRRGSRALDDALPPSGRAGPGPLGILGLGLLGGLLAGLAVGATVSAASPRIRHPWQVASGVGIRAVELDGGPRARWTLPWSEAGSDEAGAARSILMIPVGRGVDPVAPAVETARGARLQGREAAVLDLASRGEPEEVAAAEGPDGARPKVEVYTLPPDPLTEPEERPLEARARRLRVRAGQLGEDHDLLFLAVSGPDSLESVALLEPGRPVALVAGAGLTRKRELSEAVRTLRRLGAPLLAPVFYRPR